MSTLVETLVAVRTRGRARLAYSAALVVGGSLAMAALAQLSIKLPFTPVPVTGQTLGVLLIGASLGPALGGAALANGTPGGTADRSYGRGTCRSWLMPKALPPA